MPRFNPGDRVRIKDPRLPRPRTIGEVTHIEDAGPPARYVVQWSESLFHGSQACFSDADLELFRAAGP